MTHPEIVEPKRAKMNIADLNSQIASTSNEDVLHPGSRTLFRYWESLRAERACPERSEFKLADVKDVIPYLFIWAKDTARDGFRYQLSGTAVDHLSCQTMTGRDVLIGWDSFERDAMMRVFRTAHEDVQPALVRMRLFTGLNEIIGAELIALPFQRPQSREIELIGGMFPFTDLGRTVIDRISHRQLVTARTIWTEHVPTTSSEPPAVVNTPFRVIQGGRT
jgi:hypothetical protein